MKPGSVDYKSQYNTSTPVRQYVRKLTTGTKQLQAQTYKEGSFERSLPSFYAKICDAVVEAKKATKKQAKKRQKQKQG